MHGPGIGNSHPSIRCTEYEYLVALRRSLDSLGRTPNLYRHELLICLGSDSLTARSQTNELVFEVAFAFFILVSSRQVLLSELS